MCAVVVWFIAAVVLERECECIPSPGAELDLGSDLAVDLAPPGYRGDSYKADIVSCLCVPVCIYCVCVHACVRVCVHVCVCMYTSNCVRVRMCVYMYVYVVWLRLIAALIDSSRKLLSNTAASKQGMVCRTSWLKSTCKQLTNALEPKRPTNPSLFLRCSIAQ